MAVSIHRERVNVDYKQGETKGKSWKKKVISCFSVASSAERENIKGP